MRRFREEDAPALNSAVEASREHLSPWMVWAREARMSDAARRAWIRDREREAAGGGDVTYGIWRDGELAGGCGLHRRLGPGALEIGYWTHVDHLRRGVARAAVERLCALAFAQPSIRRVEIHHDPANVASAGVARAAGFTLVQETPDGCIWRLTRSSPGPQLPR